MFAPAMPRRRHPLAVRLECRRTWTEGQGTLAEVAQKQGVPTQTVVAWYRRENWTEARNRWLEKQRCDNDTPAVPPVMTLNPGISTGEHTRKLERLETQLEALDNCIDNAKTADEWHKLSTVRQRLFEQWRILSGIPLPGSRRHRLERPSYHPTGGRDRLEPIEPD